jgi:hypothetical protein
VTRQEQQEHGGSFNSVMLMPYANTALDRLGYDINDNGYDTELEGDDEGERTFVIIIEPLFMLISPLQKYHITVSLEHGIPQQSAVPLYPYAYLDFSQFASTAFYSSFRRKAGRHISRQCFHI